MVKYALNKKPIEGKKTDPAHPCIYPTGEMKKNLTPQERKVYDLIVKRFISCFCKPAVVENRKLEVVIEGQESLKFHANGLTIKDKQWLNVYPAKIKEENVPEINGEVDVKEIRIEEKQTKPPKRYTSASLVRQLEKKNLGTKATRASIVKTLYDRGYVEGKAIKATKLGINLAAALKNYSPIILDEKLTRELEKEVDEIQKGDKPEELKAKEEKILNEAKNIIKKIADDMKENEDKIGNNIKEAVVDVREKQREENTLTKCPKCGKGNLRILYNRKLRRYFVGCSNYPQCKNTYTLPPNGMIKPSKIKDKEDDNGDGKSGDKGEKEKIELCNECGFPLLISLRKGRRPWKFCFNPECPSNAEWAKKREEYKKEMANSGVDKKK